METAETTAPKQAYAVPARSTNGRPVRIDPDLQFIRALTRAGGDTYKKCFQCGTCAATCPITPDTHPFPRKEMAWALWGMKAQLLADPDVWLCHHCNDCSQRCPRSGRPGDLLAAVRREAIIHFAVPRFLARWVSRPRYIPWLLALPAILLGAAMAMRGRLEAALGMAPPTGELIVYSYSPMLPHWLLNSFFALFGGLALVAAVMGLVRFWRALATGSRLGFAAQPVRGLGASILAVIKRILTHEKFTSCTAQNRRPVSHFLVFFGFIALSLVTLWVITGPINPLLRDRFVYPFSFWSPWKMLANLGGAAVFAGCVLVIRDRFYYKDDAGYSTYFDWAFVWTLFAVVVSGFLTEALHYLRMTPHRHVVYFAHLVLVFVLLVYLPYSKFAHLLYRAAAMVFAERYGREVATSAPAVSTSGAVVQETGASA